MGALGVPPDSKGAGCTPVEHRRAIQGLFENTGILYGLDVTGTSGLEYNVGAGAAVCQRNAEDGYSIAWSDGGRVTAPEGGAGGVEAVFTALALRDQFAPPTIHYAQPDPECDLDYVPNVGRAQNMTYALSNSLGFGGHNACIALRRWEE